MIPVLTLLVAVGLALAHLFAGRLRFLDVIPRSRWLSFAGGVSVAYVFVHLLPEVSAGQAAIAEGAGDTLAFLEHHAYVLALLGLSVFYGLERAALESREQQRESENKDVTSPGIFWLHTASYSVYNGLIGYTLLHREESGADSLILFGIAIGLHFVVNDYGLRQHHKHLYSRIGRWILALAVLIGWAIGLTTDISEPALALLFAFLAGSIILNVLKEELPEERESRFGAFALGAAGYVVLLLAS